VSRHPIVLRNAVLAGGDCVDIAIDGGRIASVRPGIGDGRQTVDLNKRLVLPALVDAHVHLDKTLLGLPWRSHQAPDTTLGRIEVEKVFRSASPHSVDACGGWLLKMAVSHGTLAVRSHVDIDDQTKLSNVEALLRLREAWSSVVDIQIVAFPQSGIIRCRGIAALLDEALAMGCDLVGGLDPVGIDQDLPGHLDVVFDLAERRGVGIDLHLHDPGEPGLATLRAVAERTKALSLGGKVTVSHAFCLGSAEAGRAAQIAEELAKAGVAILTSAPGAAPMPPVRLLREAGVRVAAGSDNIRDCWSPVGNANMLERCWLIAWRAGLRTDADIASVLDLATGEAAQMLSLADYGIAAGARANLAAFDATHVARAIIERPPPDLVMRDGQVAHDSGRLAANMLPRLPLPPLAEIAV
jgi:cytosine deaminase